MKPNKNLVKFFGIILVVLVSLMFECVISDDNKDKQECTPSIVGLATCLPYVEGNSKAPTPDCCSGLKGVLKNDKKCLCLVIKDRNDPDLGLTINVTLALGLPSVCKTPADVSQCPALLHMDPNSPDAQIFYQNGHASSSISGSPASSPSATGPTGSPAVARAPGPNVQQKNDCSRTGMPWFGLGLEAVVIVLYFWTFTTNLIT